MNLRARISNFSPVPQNVPNKNEFSNMCRGGKMQSKTEKNNNKKKKHEDFNRVLAKFGSVPNYYANY